MRSTTLRNYELLHISARDRAVAAILQQKICFVTFNYDTMLDEELARLLGVQIKDMSDYAQRDYALIKLHGSVNWGREVDGINPPGAASYHSLIDAAGSLRISDRY